MISASIRVENLGKYYEIGARSTNLRANVTSWLRSLLRGKRPTGAHEGVRARSASRGLWVLKDVSFEARKGEAVGIIGRNGAGKTTLLKILSRVTPPTEGRAVLRGHLSSLLAVGTGFHPAFTGRENVYLNGMLLGMGRAEIDRKFDSIVEFSEVGEFIDTPVRFYSSGMKARLAFSVAVQLASDILILDEILAVGDAGFRQKCLNLMYDLRHHDRTVLLVSHSLGQIQQYCSRCLLIDKGRVVMDGPPDEVINHYQKKICPAGDSAEDLRHRHDREGNGRLRATDFYIEDAGGRRLLGPASGDDSVFCLAYECMHGDVLRDVDVGIAIFGDDREHKLIRLSTHVTRAEFSEIYGQGVFKCFLPRLPLTSGDYLVGFRITAEGEVVDYIPNAGRFSVMEGDFFGTGRAETHSPVLVLHEWKNQPLDVHRVEEAALVSRVAR